MKFDFRRLTPAVLTSLGLILLALLLLSVGWAVLGWILGLAGLGLNVVAVAVTEVPDTTADGTRRVASRPGAEQRSERARLARRDAAASGRSTGSERSVRHDDEREAEAEVVRDAEGQPVEAPSASLARDGKPGKGDKKAYSRAGSTAVPGSARSSSASKASAKESSPLRK